MTKPQPTSPSHEALPILDRLTAPLGRSTYWALSKLDHEVAPGGPSDWAKRRAGSDTNDAPRDVRHPRGVALLLALVTIALLSSVVVEFAYDARVNMVMATNERDRLKSYFLAKSAVNITTLLLSFQVALQKESSDTEDDMGQLISRAMRRSNFQIYQYVDLLMKPFYSGKLETPVGGIDLEESGVEGFGNFTGEFSATVLPEAGRISLNKFGNKKLDENDLVELCAMMVDARYDELFSYKDQFGETMDRQRLLANIVDFIDPDQDGIVLNAECGIQSNGGDERRVYDRNDRQRIRPRDAFLTHVEDLYMVHGVTDEFMANFADKFTVYDVGKPDINVAQAPIFYSILCRNVSIGSSKDVKGFNLCARDPTVSAQILWFAMALDGLRQFFSDPISVLLAYVGSTESKILPSAKKGQPVAFLTTGQLPRFIDDFKQNPELMAQFLQYSPFYQQIVAMRPEMAVDPAAPNFPPWTVEFSRNGLTRDVSTSSPQIFRIDAVGIYGSTETRIEAVIDMNKTMRRLPDEKELEAQEDDGEDLKALKEELKQQRELMPKGRILYWRVE